jgi:hypothetical protein
VKFISARVASTILIIVFLITIIFHFLVLSGTIPQEIVWGSRLKSRSDLVVFESVSISLNLLMLLVTLIYAGFLKIRLSGKLLRGIFWLMFMLFLLNTIGNLFSQNGLERAIFTPVTLILAILSLRLATYKGSPNRHKNW